MVCVDVCWRPDNEQEREIFVCENMLSPLKLFYRMTPPPSLRVHPVTLTKNFANIFKLSARKMNVITRHLSCFMKWADDLMLWRNEKLFSYLNLPAKSSFSFAALHNILFFFSSFSGHWKDRREGSSGKIACDCIINNLQRRWKNDAE